MARPSRAAAAPGWQEVLVTQVFVVQIKFGKRSPEVDIATEAS
jgi:hypothetical protein